MWQIQYQKSFLFFPSFPKYLIKNINLTTLDLCSKINTGIWRCNLYVQIAGFQKGRTFVTITGETIHGNSSYDNLISDTMSFEDKSIPKKYSEMVKIISTLRIQIFIFIFLKGWKSRWALISHYFNPYSCMIS